MSRLATGKVAGLLVDNLIFGSYKLTWNVRTPSIPPTLLNSCRAEQRIYRAQRKGTNDG